ncbi:MAG: PKD domain-containing protein, partial [Thermoproteota archaeon]|nr:PKD domain-containing protein [Thermoproteota archaeon]
MIIFIISFSLFAGCTNYAISLANGQKDISFDGKGSIECGNGNLFENGSLLLSGFQNDQGQLYGSFEIFFDYVSDPSLGQGGVLERGDINSKTFNIEGLMLSDTLCNNTTPQPITIIGSCEKVSVADTKTTGDQKGRFEGKVACPVVQGSGAPVAEASGPSEVLGGEEVVLDASNSYDPDRDELTFSWRQIGGPSAKVLDVDGKKPILITPAVKETSILDFEVVVTDIDGTTDARTISMVVLPKESSPVAEASGPSEVLGGEEVVLDASNSYDPDRDELTFSWRQIGGP